MSTYLIEGGMYGQCFVDQEFEVEVDYGFFPDEKGSRDEHGVPMEPDYDAHVDINWIEAVNGNPVLVAYFIQNIDTEALCEEILVHLTE